MSRPTSVARLRRGLKSPVTIVMAAWLCLGAPLQSIALAQSSSTATFPVVVPSPTAVRAAAESRELLKAGRKLPPLVDSRC